MTSIIWNYPIPTLLWGVAAAICVLVLVARTSVVEIALRYFWPATAVLFVAGMICLPSENHLLGDGLQRLSDASRTFMPTEALDVLTHRFVYFFVGSSIWSYRIVAFMGGVCYLIGIGLMMRLGNTAVERAIIGLAFLCTATIQFYFGYAESYCLLNVFTLFYIYFSWQELSNNHFTFLPLIFFLLAVSSHLSGVTLLPSLIFLYREKYTWVRKHAPYLAAVIALGVLFWGRLWSYLVPILPNDYSRYSLFSIEHIRDLTSLLILVSPAFFLSIIGRRFDKQTIFMSIALAGTFSFTVFFDPVLGAVRDWDVLSLFALPLAGLTALRCPRSKFVVGLLAVIIAIRIVPWLMFNSSLQVGFVKDRIENDIHYSAAFLGGQRLESWGVLLQSIGDEEGAERAWNKRLEIAPGDINTIKNIATMQFFSKKYDKALKTYTSLLERFPSDESILYDAAYSAFAAGKIPVAVEFLNRFSPESRSQPKILTLRAGILSASGLHREAIAIVDVTPLVASNAKLVYYLARSAQAIGRMKLARSLIESAFERDSTDAAVRSLYQSLQN